MVISENASETIDCSARVYVGRMHQEINNVICLFQTKCREQEKLRYW